MINSKRSGNGVLIQAEHQYNRPDKEEMIIDIILSEKRRVNYSGVSGKCAECGTLLCDMECPECGRVVNA